MLPVKPHHPHAHSFVPLQTSWEHTPPAQRSTRNAKQKRLTRSPVIFRVRVTEFFPPGGSLWHTSAHTHTGDAMRASAAAEPLRTDHGSLFAKLHTNYAFKIAKQPPDRIPGMGKPCATVSWTRTPTLTRAPIPCGQCNKYLRVCGHVYTYKPKQCIWDLRSAVNW